MRGADVRRALTAARSVLIPLGLAGLLASLGAGPVGAQETVWRASAGVEVESFDSELPAWSEWIRWSGAVERRFERGALVVEGFRSRRFSEWDEGAGVGVYAELWSRSYVHGRGQWVRDALALPSSDVGLELFQGVGDGWELSAGGRWLRVRSETIGVYGASVAKYLPDWYLRGRADVSSSAGGEGLYLTGAARRYLRGLDGLVELSAGTGREVAEVAAGPVVDLRDGSAAALRAEVFPHPALGVGGGVSWATLDGIPDRLGGRVSVIVRW